MKDIGRALAPAVLLAVLFGAIIPIFVHWRWLAPTIQVIEAEGFLLGLLCLAFAVRQYQDAREHTASLRENTSMLTEAKSTLQESTSTLTSVKSTLQENTSTLNAVREHVSTKFLDTFPGNIPDLTAFISGSRELDIMVDFAGYGQYSVPDQFASYFAALEDCARHRNIRILMYGPKIADLAIREQWPERVFQEEQKEPRLVRFIDNHQDLIRPLSSEKFLEQLTYQKFIDLQLKVQMQSQNQLSKIKNVSIRTIDDAELVLIAWIRDDDHAMFSIKNRGTILREVALSTRDPNLLKIFRGMFKLLWEANQPKRNPAKAAG